MKAFTIASLCLAAVSAAPLEARDDPHGSGATPDLSSLLGGMDLSKIGDLIKGIDPSTLGDLMKGFDMSKIGDLMKGFDMSKIGDLLQGPGLSNLGSILNPEMMKQYGGLMSSFVPAQKIYKMEEMKPQLRADAKKVKIIYGPYRIKGTETKGKVGNSFSLDPAGTGYMYTVGDDFPRDITVLGVESGVYDENFKPIDIGLGLYNHHNVIFNMDKTPPMITGCSNGKTGAYTIPVSIFIGGATESKAGLYTSVDGKFNSGYYVGKDAKMSSALDIVNYNKDDRMVYTVNEIEYVPGKIADALEASAQILDLGMCSGQSGIFLHPPEGVKQWSLNSTDMIMTKDGYFLGVKAHLHDGGVNIAASLNGKQFCDSRAEYGGPGREGVNPDGSRWSGIGGTTSCTDVIRVKAGDKISMSANFDVAAHPERQFETHSDAKGEMGMAEGMALFGVSFAEDAPGADPKYQGKIIG